MLNYSSSIKGALDSLYANSLSAEPVLKLYEQYEGYIPCKIYKQNVTLNRSKLPLIHKNNLGQIIYEVCHKLNTRIEPLVYIFDSNVVKGIERKGCYYFDFENDGFLYAHDLNNSHNINEYISRTEENKIDLAIGHTLNLKYIRSDVEQKVSYQHLENLVREFELMIEIHGNLTIGTVTNIKNNDVIILEKNGERYIQLLTQWIAASS
ncbi:hypothetical protein [Cytobacillus sp. IB215316]|uniref:hypothetical protein n=1 Tax=Cytobacillus sp. IB215316 TaxID=3097354 RepID=UPI002A0C898D|nr:hypothetical protein [Cytobacillus sp. IB215316]MDX8361509.1 hypothetical protein [Cytobacillus sp. IB215316]